MTKEISKKFVDDFINAIDEMSDEEFTKIFNEVDAMNFEGPTYNEYLVMLNAPFFPPTQNNE